MTNTTTAQEGSMTNTTHTLEQPFARINTPAPCTDLRRHAPAVAPVGGNADRQTPVYVVTHGHRYLTAAGELTTTPVWLTWGEAMRAEQLHADALLERARYVAHLDVVSVLVEGYAPDRISAREQLEGARARVAARR